MEENIVKLITTFRILGRLSGTAKEYALRSGDTELLRKVLLYAYNPMWSYGVKDYEKSFPLSREADNVVELSKNITKFFLLLDDLKKRVYTGDSAKYYVHVALSEILTDSEDVAEILAKVIERDLDIGCGVTTINKAFPGLIPTFECSLAKELNFKKAAWPMIGEVKYDGKRTLAVCSNLASEILLFSRNGKIETKYQHIRDEIAKYFQLIGKPGVLDGELMWGMFGSRTEGEQNAIFVAYDFIELNTWQNKLNNSPIQVERTNFVQMSVSELNSDYVKPSHVKHLPNYQHALEFYESVVNKGGEGIMLKLTHERYTFKRGYHWMKMKPVLDVDLPIIGVFEGEGKYEGMLGGIIVNNNGTEVRVGSGFSDYQRQRYWQDDLVGLIAEVRYTEVTPDNSLRFPRFVKLRDDK